MPADQHPYQHLPPSGFWRSGVAQRGVPHFEQLWTPRFPMPRGTRFATAGSCFAQHISAWLRRHGHSWLDSEPAPAGLNERERAEGGWGVFSFLTGNIYTAELFLQWVRWAIGVDAPVNEAVEHDGAWHDPFRPLIPTRGLPSAEAVFEARAHTLQRMRQALLQTDVLIFTLGLTEGWVHADGHAYPACPGTLRGRFDARVHHFVNRGVEAIVADLDRAFDALRAIRPEMRFLLTVSPVPLTATASGDHVLVATTYSKSVLRAAAGALRERRADTDYFPSYELISSFASRGRFYDDNLRTVTAEGVDFVMGHFGRAIGDDASAEESLPAPPAADGRPGGVAVAPAAQPARPRAPRAHSDEVCEDILLDTWNRAAAPAAGTRLCLMGDSHMGMLSAALNRLGVPHCGGMLMSGSDWFDNAFRPDPQRILELTADDGARQRWEQTLPFFTERQGRSTAAATVLLNLGLHTHVSVPSFLDWHLRKRGHLKLSVEDGRQFFRLINRDKLVVAEQLVNDGYRVVLVTDPPTQHLDPETVRMVPAFEAYERLACTLFAEVGCESFIARDHLGGAAFEARFTPTTRLAGGEMDWLHGSEDYYAELARQLVQRLRLAAGAQPGL
jgi:hypothetical protein